MSEKSVVASVVRDRTDSQCREIVGLRIVDRQAHRTVFDAFFHPVRKTAGRACRQEG